MEFKSLDNIETCFKKVRMYAIIFALFCFCVVVYALYCAYNFANRQSERIYVLDNGKSLMLALSQDINTNRPVEIREHVRRFHELFFTLAPDKSAIDDHMNRAFALCDKSAYTIYKDLAEKSYYNKIISGNVNQRVVIDSLICDFDHYPYRVTTHARQLIIRHSNITNRSLITTCELINTVRSDKNPHGLMMENFLIVENEDIKTVKR